MGITLVKKFGFLLIYLFVAELFGFIGRFFSGSQYVGLVVGWAVVAIICFNVRKAKLAKTGITTEDKINYEKLSFKAKLADIVKSVDFRCDMITSAVYIIFEVALLVISILISPNGSNPILIPIWIISFLILVFIAVTADIIIWYLALKKSYTIKKY